MILSASPGLAQSIYPGGPRMATWLYLHTFVPPKPLPVGPLQEAVLMVVSSHLRGPELLHRVYLVLQSSLRLRAKACEGMSSPVTLSI